MPNHVHVLFQLEINHPLSEVLHSWKSFTAKAINKSLGRAGTLWQPEYWDRLIRSERHLSFYIDYIRNNPVKAKLPSGVWSVGVPPASYAKSGRDARAPLWNLLRENPDRYIYEAVRRGAGDNPEAWEATLPDNIRCGLRPDTLNETVTSARPIQTLELRKDWNTATPPSHGLPTEIWRETIARHQRCHELRRKLRAGEVRTPADLITLNLDIRQFVQDVVAAAPADLALALWKNLRSLSVLDPTCGSGAFLFAALEILQPLYEGLLERFRTLLADWQTTGEKHPNWEKEITKILDAVARHPNEDYFIHKTIIVHNLYGVDIMEEAVEICKLRLFLKLAAQLEPGQQIEPLPDIDFNVRAGNTLVGYASREEIKKAFTEAGGSGQALLQGIENSLDDYTRIMEQAELADMAFKQFQLQQDIGTEGAAEQRKTKEKLEAILKSLRDQLDRFLAGQYDQKNLKTDTAFKKWQASHQPFHWFTEFYGIMNSGGFDVIVGNPPYVEYSKVKSTYTILDSVFSCGRCGNIYALVIERCCNMAGNGARVGMIVQLSAVCTDRMRSLQENYLRTSGQIWASCYDDRPGKLFDGLEHIRATILLSHHFPTKQQRIQTTKLLRWYSEFRENLFPLLELRDVSGVCISGSFPKMGDPNLQTIIGRMRETKKTLQWAHRLGANTSIYYYRSPLYWIRSMDFLPHFKAVGAERSVHHFKDFGLTDEQFGSAIGCIINSSIFYIWFITYGNGRNVALRDITTCPAPESIFAKKCLLVCKRLFSELMLDFKKHSELKQRKDGVAYQEFYPSKSKPIIDQIDTLLAEHYGFTEEELDFIINYDFKYRMGLGGGRAEAGE